MPVRRAVRQLESHLVNARGQTVEVRAAGSPSEQIVVVRRLAAARLNKGEARQRPPIQVIIVGRFQKRIGKPEGRAIRLREKSLQADQADIVAVIGLRRLGARWRRHLRLALRNCGGHRQRSCKYNGPLEIT